MGDLCDLGVRNGELWDVGVMGDTTSGGDGDCNSSSIFSEEFLERNGINFWGSRFEERMVNPKREVC